MPVLRILIAPLPGGYSASFLLSLTSAPSGIAHNTDHNLIIPGSFSTVSSVLAVLLLLLGPEPFPSVAVLPLLPSSSLQTNLIQCFPRHYYSRLHQRNQLLHVYQHSLSPFAISHPLRSSITPQFQPEHAPPPKSGNWPAPRQHSQNSS